MSSFGYNCHFGKILQVMKKALFNKILIGFKNRIRYTVVNGTIYTLKNTLPCTMSNQCVKMDLDKKLEPEQMHEQITM